MLTLAWYEVLASLFSLLTATIALDMTVGIMEKARNLRTLLVGKRLIIGKHSGDPKAWIHYLTVLLVVTAGSALATSGVDIDVVRSRGGDLTNIVRVASSFPDANFDGPIVLDGWGALEYLSCVRRRDGALFAAERGLENEAVCEGSYELVATPTSFQGPGGEVVGCEDSSAPLHCTTRIPGEDSTIVCDIANTKGGKPSYDGCWAVTDEVAKRVIRNSLTSGLTDEEILVRNAYMLVEVREFVNDVKFRLGLKASVGLAILAAVTALSLILRFVSMAFLVRHEDINPLQTGEEVASFYEEYILQRGKCAAREARGEVVIEQRGEEDHMNRICTQEMMEAKVEGQSLEFKSGRRPGVPLRGVGQKLAPSHGP